jgi:hypothetical protein
LASRKKCFSQSINGSCNSWGLFILSKPSYSIIKH